MSYSVCVKCNEMVPAYEKYCVACVKRYGLQQVEDFHRIGEPKTDPSWWYQCECGMNWNKLVATVCPSCHAWPKSKDEEQSQ